MSGSRSGAARRLEQCEAAPEMSALDRAKRQLELERGWGNGFSGGRMMMTLTYKYGYSEQEAAEAIKQLKAEGLTQVKADRKAGYGQIPVSALRSLARLTATEAISATDQEIDAALKLMAKTTRITRIAEDGLKKITQELEKRGYAAHTTQNRAFYTTEFTNEDQDDADPHCFQMLGWHGTGRFAGGEKTILEFYDENHSTKRPVVSIGVLNEENINPEKQLEVVNHILDYVKHHG